MHSPTSKYKNTPITSFEQQHRSLLILAGLAAILYFLFGFSSNGFYQHDEAAHYLSMRGFWNDPGSVLTNWAKPGFKLLYALPSLAGPVAVQLVNAAVAGFTCYLTALIARQLGVQMSWLAFGLLALQPFWIMLSFRNYSELLSAAILAGAVLLHLRSRYGWAALVFGYLMLVRQELYPVWGIYLIWLIWKREWKGGLLLLIWPLIHNFWGALVSGDPLYLYHALTGTTEQIKDAWPRQGGEHYFLMALTVWGAIATTLLLCYFFLAIRRKVSMHWFVVAPMVLYFLAHVAFNIQTFKLGPSTGGNLRYLIVIAPLVSALGAVALQSVAELDKRNLLLYILIPFALATAIFLTYEHNLIKFTAERSYVPFVLVLLISVLLLLPIPARALSYSILSLSVFFLPFTLRPIKLNEEDKAVQQAAKWGKAEGIEERPALAAHTLFYYFLGKDAHEMQGWAKTISDSTVSALPKGGYVVWDSHYSYRPQLNAKTLNYEYFTKQPQKFKLVREFVARDQSFGVLVFEKQ